jgi:hypothetical protein
MSKPESIRGIQIPADVDADTWRAAANAMASFGWFATSMIRGAYAAILAAKAEEREACAQVCDAEVEGALSLSPKVTEAEKLMGRRIASIIRKRGEG